MKILLTNDDSIHSAGLTLLAKQLGENHEVFVVAPRTEQRGRAGDYVFATVDS